MKEPTTTISAPTLPELREALRAAEQAYPELLRPLRQARAGVERAMGQERVTAPRDRRRVNGLR